MNAGPVQPSPWVLAGEPTSLGDPTGLITLVDGQTFCLSGRSGDFSTNPTHGVFFADMRVLSQARLLVGGVDCRAARRQPGRRKRGDVRGPFRGRKPDRAATARRAPAATGIGVARTDRAAQHGRRRACRRVVELEVAADFADVFAIKEGRPSSEGEHSLEVKENSLLFGWRLGDVHRQAELSVDGPPVQVSTRGFVWSVNIERHGVCVMQLDLTVALGNSWIERRHHHPNLPNATQPQRRLAVVGSEAAHRRPEAERGVRPLDRRHRRVAPARSDGSPPTGDRRGRAVVHDAVRSRRVDQRVHGAADRSDAGDRGARGARRAARRRGRPRLGRGARVGSCTKPATSVSRRRRSPVAARTTARPTQHRCSSCCSASSAVGVLSDDALRKLLPHADRALEWMHQYGDRDGDGYIEYLQDFGTRA